MGRGGASGLAEVDGGGRCQDGIFALDVSHLAPSRGKWRGKEENGKGRGGKLIVRWASRKADGSEIRFWDNSVGLDRGDC